MRVRAAGAVKSRVGGAWVHTEADRADPVSAAACTAVPGRAPAGRGNGGAVDAVRHLSRSCGDRPRCGPRRVPPGSTASELVGNASSTHGAGQDAQRLLEESRERVAAVLDCDPIEVVFTSGGTESINLALQGLLRARARGDGGGIVAPRRRSTTPPSTRSRRLESTEPSCARCRSTRTGASGPSRFRGTGCRRRRPRHGSSSRTTRSARSTCRRAGGRCGIRRRARCTSTPSPRSGTCRCRSGRCAGRRRAGTGLVALSVPAHKVGAPVGVGALVVSRHAKLTPSCTAAAAARPSGRHAGCRGGRRLRRRRRTRGGRARGREPSRRARCAIALESRAPRRDPGRDLLGGRRRPSPRARACALARRAGRLVAVPARRLRVSPCRPGRRARRACAEPSHVLLAMGSRPTLRQGRCGSRWVGRRHRRMWRRSRSASAAYARARRAGPPRAPRA